MKVKLLQDVGGVGQRGDVREVKDGYGQNYLIANKLAIHANRNTSVTSHSSKKKFIDKVLENSIKKLDGLNVEIQGKSNEKGHLFAQIHESDIAESIKKQHNISIPKDIIILTNPIKEVGAHTIKLQYEKTRVELELVVNG